MAWSADGASRALWGLLLVAEAYGLCNLVALTWFSGRRTPVVRPVPRLAHEVDVYVCTYDESAEILRSTLLGCQAMVHPHTTWLLDDGRRPEMQALAAEYGARYLTRPDNAHAKAGNINHALPRTTGDLVLVLDADHVPMPDALDAVVGYFDDPDVALVQTPHDFSNHDSIQHYEQGRHEQSVFFHVVCPGKDRHGAAFWCGSGGVLRREALLEIGGVATETIAEDFHSTIKLHRSGWRTRFHDEIIVQGRAPVDLAAYLLQRDRWARGNLAVLTTAESPLWARGLTARQRLSYLASLLAYVAGPVRVLLLVVLGAVLWTGQLPMSASYDALAALWLPATALSLGAGSALCRGHQRIPDTVHFELLTAEIHARALRCAVRPGRTRFKVTPKEGVDLGGWQALRQLRLLLVVTAALALGLAVRAVDAAVADIVPDLVGAAAWIVPALALFELRRLARTLSLVARRRQQRLEFRVPVEDSAVLDLGDELALARVRDLTPFGAGLEVAAPLESGARAAVTLRVVDARGEARTSDVELTVQSCVPLGGERWHVGAALRPRTSADGDLLEEYCRIVVPHRRLRAVADPVALPAPATLPLAAEQAA
jgi:cellulose synthase (UDP-forming)